MGGRIGSESEDGINWNEIKRVCLAKDDFAFVLTIPESTPPL